MKLIILTTIITVIVLWALKSFRLGVGAIYQVRNPNNPLKLTPRIPIISTCFHVRESTHFQTV